MINYSGSTVLAKIFQLIKSKFDSLATVASTGSYNDLTDKPNIGTSVRATIDIESDNVSSINIPITISDTDNLTVYLNGLLLSPTTHYTATISAITLVGYTVNKGDIFTFINGALYTAPGSGGTGSGDMLKSVYDPTGSVATAGGIPDYVANNAPVTSVNGKTGDINLVKADVGLSQVHNITQYSVKNPPPYPVRSVNGKTGDVTVSEIPSVTASDNGKVATVVNGVWSARHPTSYRPFSGASASAAGAVGLVPSPKQGQQNRYLKGDGTWADVLPQVAASDNGKFLRVVNGAWAAVTISDANGVSF